MGLDIVGFHKLSKARFSSKFLGGFAMVNVATASDQSIAIDGILCFWLKGKQLPVLDLASAVLI